MTIHGNDPKTETPLAMEWQWTKSAGSIGEFKIQCLTVIQCQFKWQSKSVPVLGNSHKKLMGRIHHV